MGTHPIFESDFDCLTELDKMRLDFPEAVDDASYRFARDVGLEPINDENIGLPSEDSMANVEQGSFRDGFISSFSMILLAEIADKTFFHRMHYGHALQPN